MTPWFTDCRRTRTAQIPPPFASVGPKRTTEPFRALGSEERVSLVWDRSVDPWVHDVETREYITATDRQGGKENWGASPIYRFYIPWLTSWSYSQPRQECVQFSMQMSSHLLRVFTAGGTRPSIFRATCGQIDCSALLVASDGRLKASKILSIGIRRWVASWTKGDKVEMPSDVWPQSHRTPHGRLAGRLLIDANRPFKTTGIHIPGAATGWKETMQQQACCRA